MPGVALWAIDIEAHICTDFRELVCVSEMGVRCLRQFVQRHSLFSEERLSDCPLVIDGCNLYWELFNRLGNITGGACQAYAHALKTFFCDLSRYAADFSILFVWTFQQVK